MQQGKTFSQRLAEQRKAKERTAERLKKRLRPRTDEAPPVEEASVRIVAERDAWKAVRFEGAHFNYYADIPSQNAEQFLQPCGERLLNLALQAADEGDCHLCLVWPAAVERAVLLHGLANLERHRAGDFRGLRTIFFPGSHSSRLLLQSVRVCRRDLTSLYLAHWTTTGQGTQFSSCTRSTSYEALLQALSNIELWSNPTADPPLAALVPSFVYTQESEQWISSSSNQLEAAIAKVNRRTNRREAKETIVPDWGNPHTAPNALMVVHNATTKRNWKQAFSSKELFGAGGPELLLLDATSSALRSNSNAVHRIPEFVRQSREHGLKGVGALIITDDPKTFFALRSKFSELRICLREHVWAAEDDRPLISSATCQEGWQPELRNNAKCRVSIVDVDAAQAAAKLQRLAHEAGSDESPGHRLLADAALFVLRLSSLPAGLIDLAAEFANRGITSPSHSWPNLLIRFQQAFESGILLDRRQQVEKALSRVNQLVEAWSVATPIAERIFSEIQSHLSKRRDVLVVVLPSRNYISVARRFLERRFGSEWTAIEERIKWHTLPTFSSMLNDEHKNHYFIVVGFSQGVMRLLLTHPSLPHGTNLLLSHRQADGALKTLRGMKSLEAFSAYRGRIGLLVQELETRLQELPPPFDFGKAAERTLTFDLSEQTRASEGEASYYCFELDGGGRLYASGWVYRYDPEENPAFRRTAAASIEVGQLVFCMGAELRSKLEDALHLSGGGVDPSAYPERTLLKLYHDSVQTQCARLFPGFKTRTALAKAIWERMVAEDASAEDFRAERLHYWLDLGDQDDLRPHAAKDQRFFRLFCKALEIDSDWADQHWNFVKSARRLNQNLGRELAARYSEILFHPESAITYRKMPHALIHELQHEALSCVFRVNRVVAPSS